MHNRFDQFAKNLLREALSQVGEAETEVEVVAAIQKIDVWCVSSRSAVRRRTRRSA